MHPAASLPRPVEDAVGVWLGHHDDIAPGLVAGLYLVGSAALGDWQPGSDVDIVAFTDGSPTDADVGVMRRAHAAAAAELAGRDVDGPRLAWADVTVAPTPIVRPWTLHGEFHHDDGCFELNPVTWCTLATYGVAVRGPAVGELSIEVDADAVRGFVRENTAGYWRSLVDVIRGALADPERTTFRSETTSWCVLGLARMLYSARTGDVASKSAAGTWLGAELPHHHELVAHALATRGATDPRPDDRETAAATAAFIEDVADLVAATGP